MCSDPSRNSQRHSGICLLILIIAVSMTASVTAQTADGRVRSEQSSSEASPQFALTATYPSGGREVASVAAADLNGDGIPDLLVANAYYSNTPIQLA